ncbi:unnamed protein product [Pleuronectes platessa]|uniref:Uncharacterized protein n=1 Tax=Pleuronectes platessa TaxID=8262 RepID=A0A9N7UKY6_PLEPL|nr:unnamed protein product [Pleuronectes platessa]
MSFVVKPLGTCRGWGSSRPPLRAAGGSVCGTPQVFFGGGPHPRRLTASLVCGLSLSWTMGRCPLAVRKVGSWRRPGTVVGGGDSGRVSIPSRGSTQLRRPLGEPSVREGGPPSAVRLGWSLAPDLVRTRGTRLFN